MKKVFALTIIIGLLLFTNVCSAVTQFNADQRLRSAENENNTANYTATDMSTTTVLVAGTDLVVGYTYCPFLQASNASADCWLEIHDAAATSSTLTDTFILETRIDRSESRTVWFPYPIEIKNGIVVKQSGYTQLIIWYERP